MFSSVCIWLGPSVMVCWLCFLPPPLALPFSDPAQIPDSPAAPKLLSLLSLTLSSLARLFSHLLRRPPPEVLGRRPAGLLSPASLPASRWTGARARGASVPPLAPAWGSSDTAWTTLRGTLAPGRGCQRWAALVHAREYRLLHRAQPWPHPDACIPSSFLTPTEPLHAGPTGSPARTASRDRLSTFKEKSPVTRLTPLPAGNPRSYFFLGHLLPGSLEAGGSLGPS